MRRSLTPVDKDYVGDDFVGDILLNGRFFDLGPIITFDPEAGVIEHFRTKNGEVELDGDRAPIRALARGRVQVFEYSPPRAIPVAGTVPTTRH